MIHVLYKAYTMLYIVLDCLDSINIGGVKY
jgi:hypothetical protein